MTNIVLKPSLVVRDGKMRRELLTFSDILDYVAPTGAAPAMGIGKIVLGAKSADDQNAAAVKFREWAAKSGLLIYEHEH
ncbi:hypothetical protein [Flaviflagellibacter deserti]|uniref:Uncharacterized protein n=1 Tax=Flaviflagellibacter deserti TaxID=2267266 RepID=A0ABV9YXL7_9HYPH